MLQRALTDLMKRHGVRVGLDDSVTEAGLDSLGEMQLIAWAQQQLNICCAVGHAGDRAIRDPLLLRRRTAAAGCCPAARAEQAQEQVRTLQRQLCL